WQPLKLPGGRWWWAVESGPAGTTIFPELPVRPAAAATSQIRYGAALRLRAGFLGSARDAWALSPHSQQQALSSVVLKPVGGFSPNLWEEPPPGRGSAVSINQRALLRRYPTFHSTKRLPVRWNSSPVLPLVFLKRPKPGVWSTTEASLRTL